MIASLLVTAAIASPEAMFFGTFFPETPFQLDMMKIGQTLAKVEELVNADQPGLNLRALLEEHKTVVGFVVGPLPEEVYGQTRDIEGTIFVHIDLPKAVKQAGPCAGLMILEHEVLHIIARYYAHCSEGDNKHHFCRNYFDHHIGPVSGSIENQVRFWIDHELCAEDKI